MSTPNTERGIFNSEGCIERGFYTEESASAALAAWIEQGEDPDELSVSALCIEHDEQPADSCEECYAEDEADDGDDDDEGETF